MTSSGEVRMFQITDARPISQIITPVIQRESLALEEVR